jgi:hypothetical protein
MRISLLLLLINLILMLILWVTLSGALLWLAVGVFVVYLVILVGYADKAVLFFLGAREVKSNDEPDFLKASAQEAYKLRVRPPVLYFYNGSRDRAFALENRSHVSLVFSRQVLDTASASDLEAICFELLLQVSRGLAPKRTRMMFLLGMITWCAHAFTSLLTKIFKSREINTGASLFLNYFLYPWIEFLFRLFLGNKYFKKLRTLLKEYPSEWDNLQLVGKKFAPDNAHSSIATKKISEFSSASRSFQFQNIFALESLPHEWDFLFSKE